MQTNQPTNQLAAAAVCPNVYSHQEDIEKPYELQHASAFVANNSNSNMDPGYRTHNNQQEEQERLQ